MNPAVDSGSTNQQNGVLPALGLFENGAIQFRDCGIELIEQFQKLIPASPGPRSQGKRRKLTAAFPGEQLLLAAQSLAHRQKMKLIAQHGAQAHQLVTMPKQLPEVTFRWRGNPDPWKALGQQKIENERSIALIGLLLAHFAGANLSRVADP